MYCFGIILLKEPMAYPKIKKNLGKDFNFYQVVPVNWYQFGSPDGYTIEDGYGPDIVITFTTQGLSFINFGTAADNIVEYSFNGNTVHGDLTPYTSSASLVFDNRIISCIWFRLKAGATGPVNIRIEAWSQE